METFTKLTWPIGWLSFAPLQFQPTIWAQSYSRKRTKCITPLQERHFPTPLRRSVTRGGAGGRESPLENFSPPLEKCVGHILKILQINSKNLGPFGKVFAPPGVPSWLRACHYVMQKNSRCFETERSYRCRVLYFNRQNLMLISLPKD